VPGLLRVGEQGRLRRLLRLVDKAGPQQRPREVVPQDRAGGGDQRAAQQGYREVRRPFGQRLRRLHQPPDRVPVQQRTGDQVPGDPFDRSARRRQYPAGTQLQRRPYRGRLVLRQRLADQLVPERQQPALVGQQPGRHRLVDDRGQDDDGGVEDRGQFVDVQRLAQYRGDLQRPPHDPGQERQPLLDGLDQ